MGGSVLDVLVSGSILDGLVGVSVLDGLLGESLLDGMFKICDSTGYTYDMKVYLGKDRQCTVQHVTATHATETELTRKIEGRGHKLYMDNFFSSPELFDDLVKKQIYCCGTFRPNRKGMP